MCWMSFCWGLMYSVCLLLPDLLWMFRAWWGNLRQQFHLKKRSSNRPGAGRRSKCRRLRETRDLPDCLSPRKFCKSCSRVEGEERGHHHLLMPQTIRRLNPFSLPNCLLQKVGLWLGGGMLLQTRSMECILLPVQVCRQKVAQDL